MNEERTLVLEMLSAGKITIEQANQLIDALGEKPLSSSEEWPVTVDQITELSEREVDPSYLKALREVSN